MSLRTHLLLALTLFVVGCATTSPEPDKAPQTTQAQNEPVAASAPDVHDPQWIAKTPSDYQALVAAIAEDPGFNYTEAAPKAEKHLPDLKQSNTDLYTYFAMVVGTYYFDQFKDTEDKSSLFAARKSARLLADTLTHLNPDVAVYDTIKDNYCTSLSRVALGLVYFDQIDSDPIEQDFYNGRALMHCDAIRLSFGAILMSAHKDHNYAPFMKDALPYLKSAQNGDPSRKAILAYAQALQVDTELPWDEFLSRIHEKYTTVVELPLSHKDTVASATHNFLKGQAQERLTVAQKAQFRNQCHNALSSNDTAAHLVRTRAIDSYIRLHNLYLDGSKETKPVYDSFSGGEKYISEYQVSPKFYQLETDIPGWRARYGKYSSPLYQHLSKAVDYLEEAYLANLEGYYVKKKDYRGQFERAHARWESSKNALEKAIDVYGQTTQHPCAAIFHSAWTK